MNGCRNVRSWMMACGALLAAGACTTTLTLDDGQGSADAGDASAGGQSGSDAEAVEAGAPLGGSGGGSAVPSRDAGTPAAEPDSGGESRPPEATTRWTGNAADCPPAAPEAEALCDVAESQVCAYFGDDPENQAQSIYRECACRAFCGSSAAELHWDCYRNIGAQRMACPPEQPESRSSCFGLKGVQCWYPQEVTCSCPTDPNDSSWRCIDESAPAVEHPAVVDPDTVVRDMTAEDRQAWCEWYTRPEPGFPPPPELEPDPDGFYPDTGCASSTSFLGCAVSRPSGLPASACVANLELSPCEATVRDLNDCALSMRYFKPSPYGCARYLDAPGCAGTIVVGAAYDGLARDGGLTGCRVRVQ